MVNTLYVLVLTATLAVLAGAQNNKYCNLQSCRGNPHTYCQYSSTTASRNCGSVKSKGVSSAEIKELLDIHNKYRDLVASGQEKRGSPGPQPAASKGIGHLQWSSELAEIAQAWANQCNFNHDKCRDTANMKVGQNLAIASNTGNSADSLSKMVTGWYDEVKDFDRNKVKSFSSGSGAVVGHYTQMVWAKTTHVGCAVIEYNNDGQWNNKYLVCNYGPAGNFIGQPIYV